MEAWNALPAQSGNTLPAQPVTGVTDAESYQQAPLSELRYASDLVPPVVTG
jgi:hypothetical protein